MALLEPDAVADLSGEAAESVKLSIIEQEGAPPVLELLVSESPFDREADVELQLTYGGGLKERLRFFVVSRAMISNEREKRIASPDGGDRS